MVSFFFFWGGGGRGVMKRDKIIQGKTATEKKKQGDEETWIE